MKLLAIDGNSIINRAFFAIRRLNASDGTPTNAIYGFLTTLERLINDEKPDALCVTFDTSAPTFRHERFDGYKAKRTSMPEELSLQMPVIKEILDAMNIRRYELRGWEADDLLGTIAGYCETAGWECVVVTGDRDTLQLVSDLTRVRLVKTKGGQPVTLNYTPEMIRDEFGFGAEKIVDFKALMGDSSDNIPGVPGVGEKTAMELVQKYGRIANLYEELSEIDVKETLRNKLIAGRESAEMSYELALISKEAPLEMQPQDCIIQEINKELLYSLFNRLGFVGFIDKLKLRTAQNNLTADGVNKPSNVHEVTDIASCEKLIEKCLKAEHVSVYVDMGFRDAVAVLPSDENEVYVVRHSSKGIYESLLSRLLKADIKKVGHDVKDMIKYALSEGFIKSGDGLGGWIFDTALAAYLVSPTDGNYALNRIAALYCGYSLLQEDESKAQLSLLDHNGAEVALKARAVALLKEGLSAKLIEMRLDKLYYEIELPLCAVLAEMENTGFLIDRDAITEFGNELSEKISEVEQVIYEHAGESFNINSPKQLGVVLFEKLMLPSSKKTKTGWSTSSETLDSLAGKHPIIELIKQFREYSKLKSTYTDGLLRVASAEGRIHTHFQMTATATGRLSSTEPNLQNIPVRKKIGEKLRKMFIANDGMVLVDADYSQIELRLLAHIADDPVMLKAFSDNEDIHTVTASQVFGCCVDEVDSLQRSRAKAVNFGIVYGISAFSLAQDIGVSAGEARTYIDSYLEKYAGVKNYMINIVQSAKRDGFVETLYGRKRQLPELKSSNRNIKAFGERIALNMPIQGTAADIMKIAMLNVHQRLHLEKPNAKLILQVHDELIVECPEDDAEAVSLILREEMEGAAKLNVPLVAETRTGKSWYDTK